MISRTRSVVLCGLAIALLAAGAAIVVPLGPVPFTAQTLMLALIMLVLTPKESAVAVGGYLVLGSVGLPIFAGFKGGFGALLGPTGGFIIGFFVAICLIALLRTVLPAKIADHKIASIKAYLALDIVWLIILPVVYYAFGLAWFCLSTGSGVVVGLAMCVLPFVLPDIIKSVVAFSFAQPIRLALGRAPQRKIAATAQE
jgi:biotin transport system substrate-specific component